MTTILSAPPAEDACAAYEALADGYDVLTAGYPYDRWLDQIEAIARQWGVRGRRMFDVACGTGRSFAPLLERGWEVVACDLSPAMAARAHERAAGRAEVFVADMRALDSLRGVRPRHVPGRPAELPAVRGRPGRRAREPAPQPGAGRHRGLGREHAAHVPLAVDERGRAPRATASWSSWRGRTPADIGPGDLGEAEVDVIGADGAPLDRACTGSGTGRSPTSPAWPRARGPRGRSRSSANYRGARLERDVDEAVHGKALFVARTTTGTRGEVRNDDRLDLTFAPLPDRDRACLRARSG